MNRILTRRSLLRGAAALGVASLAPRRPRRAPLRRRRTLRFKLDRKKASSPPSTSRAEMGFLSPTRESTSTFARGKEGGTQAVQVVGAGKRITFGYVPSIQVVAGDSTRGSRSRVTGTFRAG